MELSYAEAWPILGPASVEGERSSPVTDSEELQPRKNK